ncbi:MAG: outer membrane protein assembly factor BamA [Bacteroidales bacterium]|nr:outer membrane protein assembly factor BamA [Bacteroidales bacterium]
MKNLLKPFTVLALLLAVSLSGKPVFAQGIEVDYANPKSYVLGGVNITGLKYLSAEQLLSVLGFREGDTVTLPSEEISNAVKRLWLQGATSQVGLYIERLSAARDTAWLRLDIEELPRVLKWDYRGVRNGERDDLKEKLNLRRGGQLSEYVLNTSVDLIKDYYKEKGFLNVAVDVEQVRDSIIKNAVKVTFVVNKGKKVKVKEITYEGTAEVSKYKLDKTMKKTKDRSWYNFFKSKKFNEDEYANDKKSLLDAFNEAGYRDARVVSDSLYYIEEGRLGIHFVFDPGKKYYFRDITWTGNSEYDAEVLNSVLHIDKGSVYDVITMEKRLYGGDPNELSIAKLYRDNGYLFFNVTPVEINIEGDSVDVEMRLVEGKPATFNNIIINGNTLTNEKVVRRAVFTRPGYLFRQTDFERSIREISSMGHFDAEVAADPQKGYNIVPNPLNNTVDISYNVEEKSNSQIELSGGWGNRMFVGTLGLSFNNFSTYNFFKKEAWRPVPLGDAQQLAIRFQTNGTYYTTLSASFVEPWLTGKKPTSLSFSAYFSRQTNSYFSAYYNILNNDQYMEVFGASLGLGTRLKWPDTYFVFYNSLGWQTYKLKDWSYYFIYNTGVSHNLSWTSSLSRNSTDQTIYPRQGSDFNFTMQLTPPWSLMRKNASSIDWSAKTIQEHFRWIEYNKWTFKGSVYTRLVGDLVLMTRAYFGYLGYYNRKWGYSPFEGFIVGGDGMSGYNTYGSEVIGLRGYENYSLTPYINGAYAGNVYDKFTVELRYPLIMQPSSTIFALAFLEAGNCWSDIHDFNPFQVKRSAGVGLRVFLSIVGLLGIDWGYGFDATSNKSQFHFVIGQQF